MPASLRYSLAARLHERWRQYAENRRGAAAVEFAMIAVPFFFMIFGLIEVCMIFIASSVLDHAVYEASRPIRTGGVQRESLDKDEFRATVCERFYNLMDCNNLLHVDVRTINRFGLTPNGIPTDAAGNIDPGLLTYNPGGPAEIVAVRVFYEWPLFTPVISRPLVNMPGNKHLLHSAAVFRNEPFTSGGGLSE
ncbi:TadE/TadG family type IV pilus assembly protein [Hyphomonas sp.]|uniref:TadE/TadG family type IV pilus assembly protein n=1 Tax=Hyphomonas sp. TaxID=87 RepID=UPI00391B00D6